MTTIVDGLHNHLLARAQSIVNKTFAAQDDETRYMNVTGLTAAQCTDIIEWNAAHQRKQMEAA